MGHSPTASRQCQCIECGEKELHTEATIHVFVVRKGVGIYCNKCGENAVFPYDNVKDGRS